MIKPSVIFFALLCFYCEGLAQPFSLDERINPIELKLLKINPPKKPKAKGRIAISNIVQTEDTMYFFANGFSIFSPAYVGVTTKKETPAVEVNLCKQNWHTTSRSGTTNEKGHWEGKFKTEGDFGIMVVAKTKPAKYSIVVWNGEDAKIDMPSPFKGDKGAAATEIKNSVSGGGKSNNLLYIIIGVLAVAIAVLIFKLKNKKS
jgi:hypothetical protein